jgi:hypothetical protein
MNKLVSALTVVSLTTSVSLFAGGDMPPMPPSFGTKAPKAYPTSCNSLPQMIVFLPPPMEVDFIQCKNDLNMPSLEDSLEVLKAKFNGLKISDVKISLAEGFYQLYRITFKVGEDKKELLVNSELSKFIDNPVISVFKAPVKEEVKVPTSTPTVPMAENQTK